MSVKFLISTKYLNKPWRRGYSLEEAYNFMTKVGADGLDVVPQNSLINNQLKNPYSLPSSVLDSIASLGQSPRSETIRHPLQFIQMAWRHGNIMAVVASSVAFPYIRTSLSTIDKFLYVTGKSRPVQIYPFRQWDKKFPDSQYDEFFMIPDRHLLAQPELLGHWDVEVDGFAEAARERGFNGIIINTHHLRREPDKSQGVDTMFPNWTRSLPILMNSGMVSAIQIQPNTSDELNSLLRLQGGEMMDMIRAIAQYESVKTITIQISGRVIAELLGEDDTDFRQATYQPIIYRLRTKIFA